MPNYFSQLARSITGIPPPREELPRFEEEVTVRGNPRFWKEELPDKQTLQDIYLGSPGKRPTGTHIPDFTGDETRLPDPDKYPKTRASFEKLAALHPDVASKVWRLHPNYSMIGSTINAAVPGTGTDQGANIQFSPVMEERSEEDRMNTLRHELVHIAQGLNHPKGLQFKRLLHQPAVEEPAYYASTGRGNQKMSEEESNRFIENTWTAEAKHRDKAKLFNKFDYLDPYRVKGY